ncbi:hypothetical protein MKW92_051424 [Papaver armeniacum]|nr:hypothetical protein MKW92_051424 [Papaver armeniacum]
MFPQCAPSFNGTIIPISISQIHTLHRPAKSGVLVEASRPILLPYIIGRSSSKNRARNASFPFVPLLHFLLLESKGDLSYLESSAWVLCRSERARRMKIHLSHGGVCIFMLGVLLSNTKKIPLFFASLDHLHGPTFRGICGNLMIYKPSLTKDRLIFEHDSSLPRSSGYTYKSIYGSICRLEQKFQQRKRRYTTLMKLPFIFCIRIGFLLASSGGSRSLRILLKKEKLHWNRESREVNDLEGISKKLRRLFLELFHKRDLPLYANHEFSLFLSYIVITPLMIGSIRIPLLFPSPTEPFPRNEKEDGTLELYYLSVTVIQISRVFCGFPMLQLLVPIRSIRNGSTKHSIREPVLTLLCGIHSRSALGITSSSGWNSSQNSTTSPTSLPLTVSRTSIETEWFHVPSSIGYSFLFVSLFPILVSICLKD